MKKNLVIAVLLSSVCTFSIAQHRHQHYHSDVYTPLIIGGIIAYTIKQQQTSRRDDPPLVVYQPAPQIIYQTTPKVYPLNRPPEPVYEKRIQYDPVCNCQTEILVQIGWK